MKVKFTIRRVNPAEHDLKEPYLQAYDLDVPEGMTILEALLKIADDQDPTLGFRRSCRSAICGSCAVVVNGFTRLACATQVLPEYEKMKEMLIEPLANHDVQKDLIVDMEPFWSKIEKITPYVTATPESMEKGVTAADVAAINESQQCIMCGCCNSECNALSVDEKYAGPAALAKAWRFVGDVREGGAFRRLEKLSDTHGMWDCVRCVHCTQYCPKGVAPLKQIEMLRYRAIKEGITDNHGAKHAVSMARSVKRVGRLDEAAMTFKTLGFLRSLGMIPFGLKMELHGKMPLPLLFDQIEKMDEVEKIFEECERLRAEKK